jgi:hypothetical protein
VSISVASDTTAEGIEAYKISLLNSLGVDVATALTGIINDAAASTNAPFTLTTSVETFNGGADNDTFNATDAAQLQAGDVITGGLGTDTLNYTNTAAAAIAPAAISGVEIFNVRAVGNDLASTDLSLYSGVTTFNLDRSTNSAAVTNMAAGGVYGIVGNASVTNSDVTGTGFGYAAAATAAVLNVSGGTLGTNPVTVTGTGLTSQVINSTGATNVIGAFVGAASTTATTINATTKLTTGAASNLGATLTVTGAGAVDLSATALEVGVTKLDASGNSGGLTATLSATATQVVTGSTGNDVFTIGAATLTTGSINAGLGTDTLVIGSNVGNVNTTALAAKYTGFETLSLSGTLDMALIGSITAVEVTNAATLTNMSAVQAANVKITANNSAGTGDNQVFTLAVQGGTADVLTITAGTGLTTAAATDIGTLNVTGFETLNIKTNSGPTSATGAGATARDTLVGALTGATLKAINLSGSSVNMSNIATTVAVTIDGSALVGDGASTPVGLTVAGSAVVGSTITGSNFKDAFTIGAEGSAYNGGLGDDGFTTTVALLVADGTDDGTINGAGGTDTLTVSNTTGVTLTDNHFTKLSNMETLALTATGAGDVSVTVGGTFNAAFATGATITTGKLAATQDVAFVGGLATVGVKLTIDADLLVGTAAETHNIVTGTGADTVTFTGDATYVGVGGGAQGTIVISTGAGADTISVTTGTSAGTTSTTGQFLTITPGTGADSITLVGINGINVAAATAVISVASGDSGLTVGTWDKITGFGLGAEATSTIADRLEFPGTGAVGTLATSTDFGTILTHALTSGVATFDTAATFVAAKMVNASNLADVVGYLAANTATADAVAFLFDSNSDGVNDSTLVFSNQAADSLVELVGTTVLGVSAITTIATLGFIAIS